jgi:hypothetical protein
MPRLVQADVHRAEVNWAPLSVVTVTATPKHATQLEMKASAHVLASMLHRGLVSNHLVDLSMMVSRYTWLSEEAGRGPTMSTCTWENLRAGTGNGLQGSCWLLVNLSPLTLLTIPAHGCHISVHALPHETCRYHPLGNKYARVHHVVVGLENGRPIHQRYQWPSVPRHTAGWLPLPGQFSLTGQPRESICHHVGCPGDVVDI